MLSAESISYDKFRLVITTALNPSAPRKIIERAFSRRFVRQFAA
jgi:hypothetical protein